MLFNVQITGTFSATLTLERSFDSGLTWAPLSADVYGTAVAFTAPASLPFDPADYGMTPVSEDESAAVLGVWT